MVHFFFCGDVGEYLWVVGLEFGYLCLVVRHVICLCIGFRFFGLFLDELAYEIVLGAESTYVLVNIVSKVVATVALYFLSVLEALS